jgi:cholesterol oxidase
MMSYNRRKFIQTAGAASVGILVAVGNGSIVKSEEVEIEALIIGSGFGGAVAALRLGRAGIKTMVLERGRRWDIKNSDTFATYRKPDKRAAWFSRVAPIFDPVAIDEYAGLVQVTAEDGINVVRAAAVGGGSVHYNGITYQPPRETFYKSFPTEINYDEMDRVYYPLVHKTLNTSRLPEDILQSNYYKSTRVFLEQAKKAGFKHGLLQMATDWNVVRNEISGTAIQSAIIGEIWYGINSGAKNSLDKNYLPLAEQTGNVRIMPLHVVTEVASGRNEGYVVSCNQIDEKGNVINNLSIKCRHLFMAAGSMGTTKLLLRAKEKGTIPNINNFIGKDWGNNGDTLGVRSGLGPTNPGQGGPATSYLEHLDNPLGPVILIQYPTWNAPEGTLSSLAMAIPKTKGEFRYDQSSDTVKLNWPINSAENQLLLKNVELTYSILDKSNSTTEYKMKSEIKLGGEKHNVNPKTIQNSTSSNQNTVCVHPLGGAVMGKVCDTYGRVIGCKGLYVIDGALIPGSTGCTPPSITIAALAERAMNSIIPEIKRT